MQQKTRKGYDRLAASRPQWNGVTPGKRSPPTGGASGGDGLADHRRAPLSVGEEQEPRITVVQHLALPLSSSEGGRAAEHTEAMVARQLSKAPFVAR